MPARLLDYFAAVPPALIAVAIVLGYIYVAAGRWAWPITGGFWLWRTPTTTAC